MNWQTILKDLKDRGWTQAQLAEHIGVVQSAISDLSRGAAEDPKFSTGSALKELHESGAKAPSAAAATGAA